jgi:Putative prokaryotic signal transducing protein
VWTCSKCEAEGEDNFDLCWNCGAARDGEADPPFDPEFDGVMGAEQFQAEAEARLHDRFVTVATFWNPVEAHVLVTRLEGAGVRAFVMDEETVAMDWLLANAVGGVKVQVAERDLERARQVLAERAPKRDDRDDEDDGED